MEETVTLGEAKGLLHCLAPEESLLLLSSPGVGKSEIVRQAAAEAGLECRSLLGTQIAPEDVSGVPKIVGERSVFFPPRILVPESDDPFCLFLDELPACAPDIQKAFYALLLERRVGETRLPKGSWVVAAGNRAQDRALVRTISAALVNRVILLNVRPDFREWLEWAQGANVHPAVVSYLQRRPEALFRPVPNEPVPFSTPRAWTLLAGALTLLGKRDGAAYRDGRLIRALARGRVSADDADDFADFATRFAEAGDTTRFDAPAESEVV